MAAVVPKKLMLMHYEFVEGMLQKRAPYREAHLKHMNSKAAEGRLISAGAVGPEAAKALCVFENTSEEEIEEFVKADPFYQNGLVKNWYTEPYGVCAGTLKDKA